MNITDAKVDAGAKALREETQKGKRLNRWSTLPNAIKNKWRDKARIVLVAAEQA